VTEMATETRRTLLKKAGVLGGALTVPGLLAACGGGDAASTATTGGGGGAGSDIAKHVRSKVAVFADWGGLMRDARTKVYVPPFTAATGARVVFADADGAKFVLQAERGRGQWDGYDPDGFELIDYKKRGLLQTIPDWVPRCDHVDPQHRDVCTGGFAYSFVNAYNTDQFSGTRVPETWADFWDVGKFPGKRAYPKFYYAVAEPAAMADGITRDQMYPLDFDRVYAKLDELRDDILFYESYAQAAQMIATGGVAMGLLPNGRAQDARNRGGAIEIMWNEAVLLPWQGPIVPRGAPHADAMFGLMAVMSDPRNQAALAVETSYAPTISAAYEFIDDRTLATLANSDEHRAIAMIVDTDALAEQNAEYSESYTRWLGGA
jgi:putative spermidine/putrescine transport system substrate-binding protein